MKSWLLAIALIGSSHSEVPFGDEIEIRPGTKITFASAATCGRLLFSRDICVQTMSPFDRSARLKTDKDVTETEYLAFVARQAKDWSNDQKRGLVFHSDRGVEHSAHAFRALPLDEETIHCHTFDDPRDLYDTVYLSPIDYERSA